MYHAKVSLCACFALVAWMGAANALAQEADPEANPGAIAKRCIAHITDLADRCVHGNRTTASNAARKINVLQSQEHDGRAKAVAHEAIEKIKRHSNACVEKIRTKSQRCIEELKQLGADRWANAVAKSRKKQVDRVRRSEVAAIARIRKALNN